MHPAIHEFKMLKAFNIEIHAPKAPKIIQVDWHPPICGWIKVNSDGSAQGNPRHSSCGVIFRDSRAAAMGSFSHYIGIATSFYVEMVAAIMSIEFAYAKGWHKLWLECDSKMVVQAFKNMILFLGI